VRLRASRIVAPRESQQDRAMDAFMAGASLDVVALSIFTFLLAGTIKGVIGLGLPSIAIGLLALLMTPAQAAAIMIVPSLVTNVWQMLAGPHFITMLRRLWSLVLASALGIWLGGGVITSANSRLAALGLGVALVIYAAIGLTAVRFSVERRHEWWLSPIVGLATGFVAGGTGVFVIPAGPYFQAIALGKDELVQALGLSFTVSTVVLALVLWRDGAMHLGNAAGSMLAVLPALAGMMIGQRIRSVASEETFRRWFFLGLLLLGTQQALRNAF
jgi:uncharacterized membrane protein YfcA